MGRKSKKRGNMCISDSQVVSVKEYTCNVGDAGDMGMILGLGRSPGEGNCSPLQYSCWRIPWTEEPGKPVHGVTELDMAECSTLELRASGDWCWKWLETGPWESMEGGKHLLGWKEESTIVPPQNGPGSSHSTYTESSPSTGFLSISVSHLIAPKATESNVKNWVRAGVAGQEEASFSPSLCGCGEGRGYQNGFGDQSV